jgi:hypothetical protein
MIISLINHTNLPDVAVQQAIRAVNVQIEQDFYPYWSIGATLRLEGRIGEDPDLENLAASLRGDAILYLEDTIDKEDPLGFHNLHFSGIPFGFVFTEISGQMGEPWQVTLSARSAGADRRRRGEPVDHGPSPGLGAKRAHGVPLV